ncbi:exonuclease domain-containing protein [Leucobacter sp. M11]|uniref:exonuclease domain-containing protein n=1 Tax=Leucobacter sp. M11 TaxID=2993565 RepID=UPI002D810231|nr:exonuclease domain-containing protein [Leucobacter sp. M11]MEB4616342.1 exonuclease domain-containing protein [Leucobacter sp. M11]
MTQRLPLWAENLAVFDTETTGIDPANSRVVTASIALLSGDGAVSERYDWVLNPGVPIPEAAANVHGITTEMAERTGMDAQSGIEQIVRRMTEMLERGFPLVAYNAPFDLTLLRAEAERYGVAWPAEVAPVLDPLILDKQLDRYRKGKRTLIAVSEHYGVDLSQAHDAGADAIAAGRVLQAVATKYAADLPAELEQLHAAQVNWAAAQAENFQAYMRRAKDPAFVADGTWPIREVTRG